MRFAKKQMKSVFLAAFQSCKLRLFYFDATACKINFGEGRQVKPKTVKEILSGLVGLDVYHSPSWTKKARPRATSASLHQ
jgi:hypothetical protein